VTTSATEESCGLIPRGRMRAPASGRRSGKLRRLGGARVPVARVGSLVLGCQPMPAPTFADIARISRAPGAVLRSGCPMGAPLQFARTDTTILGCFALWHAEGRRSGRADWCARGGQQAIEHLQGVERSPSRM
jgi:hypothetical protein